MVAGLVFAGLLGTAVVGLGMGRPPAAQQISGRVTALDVSNRRQPGFAVRTDQGQTVFVQIDLRKTRIGKGGRGQAPSDLRVGDRVQILAEIRKDRVLAKVIQIERPPPAKPSTKPPATRRKR